MTKGKKEQPKRAPGMQPSQREDWEDVKCAVCMEYPHEAVLLICSSHNKNCRPYLCGTKFRNSNCHHQYKKACGELPCPRCRGQVQGWIVEKAARVFLNAKKRRCMQDECLFAGNYEEMRKHVKAEHFSALPLKDQVYHWELIARRAAEAPSEQRKEWLDLEHDEENVDDKASGMADEDDTQATGDEQRSQDVEKRSYMQDHNFIFDGDHSEKEYYVSPNASLKRNFSSWRIRKNGILGIGSFGIVYEGFTDEGFFLAVKAVSFRDHGSQELEQEISLLSELKHENIVQYLGTDRDNDRMYIFLELVPKGSIDNLYKKHRLEHSQVSSYTRQILSGLKHLHDHQVVHRDIKCANILIDANGIVKLADFGLAKKTELNDLTSSRGSPFWMAPEVVRSKSSGYGLPADIWSLGCTVLEMLHSSILTII